MGTRYLGVSDLEVLERLVFLLKRKEVFTVKLERVIGGHLGPGVWDMEVTEG